MIHQNQILCQMTIIQFKLAIDEKKILKIGNEKNKQWTFQSQSYFIYIIQYLTFLKIDKKVRQKSFLINLHRQGTNILQVYNMCILETIFQLAVPYNSFQ